MSHGKLRTEKDCLNCGHPVEARYCPNCGQENIEPKQPFHYLFTHFAEDFTHYDSQFWRTLKYLLFAPGKLTALYLSGKRQAFVSPVKLYIFVSFITFFIPSLFPSPADHSRHNIKTEKDGGLMDAADSAAIYNSISEIKKHKVLGNAQADSIEVRITSKKEDESNFVRDNKDIKILGTDNVRDFDAKVSESEYRKYAITKPFVHKIFELKEEGYSNRKILSNFLETFIHNLPKALFLYMPVFAFFMWLFYDRKKWYYFDHGIFTLHYFSFLLLGLLAVLLMDEISDWVQLQFFSSLVDLFAVTVFFYSIIYFFIAQQRVYGSSIGTAAVKSGILLLVNTMMMVIFLIGLFIISFLLMH